jgi:hypothetical protein
MCSLQLAKQKEQQVDVEFNKALLRSVTQSVMSSSNNKLCYVQKARQTINTSIDVIVFIRF